MKKIIRYLYALLPFKQPLLKVVRWLGSPSKNTYKHLHFNGVITVSVPNTSKSFRMHHFGYELENELFWEGLHGIHESESMKLWMKLCENASTILDVGANTGIYALVASTINPTATHFAFEPVRRIYDRLIANTLLNSSSITCIPKALSDYSGEGFYFDTMTPHLYSATVNKNIHSTTVSVQKQTLYAIKLDDFIVQHKILKIDLLKIDVETHEPEVISGYLNHIEQHIPDMLMEVLNEDVANRLNQLLRNTSYLYYDIDEVKGPTRIPKIQKSSGRNILICKPESALKLGLSAA